MRSDPTPTRFVRAVSGLLLAVAMAVAVGACTDPAAPAASDGVPAASGPAAAPTTSGSAPIVIPDPSGKGPGPSPSLEVPPPID